MSDISRRLEHRERKIVERIYLKYSKDLFHFAYSMCSDYDLAQDFVDQAFENWITRAPNIKKEEKIFHYLLVTVKNAVYNFNRDHKKYCFFGEEGRIDYLEDPNSLHIIENINFKLFIQSVLTLEEYIIVYYHDVYEYEFKFISKIVHKSERMVRHYYHKIVERVRKLYLSKYHLTKKEDLMIPSNDD